MVLLQFAVKIMGPGYGLLVALSVGERFLYPSLSKWVHYFDWFAIEVAKIDLSQSSVSNYRQFINEGEPVGATILAFLILDEAPTWSEIVGGLLILVGIFVAFRRGGTTAIER